jgi:hypothetical protein
VQIGVELTEEVGNILTAIVEKMENNTKERFAEETQKTPNQPVCKTLTIQYWQMLESNWLKYVKAIT